MVPAGIGYRAQKTKPFILSQQTLFALQTFQCQ